MASEEFAYLLQARPGSFLFVGNGDSAPLHSPLYDFDDAIIAPAASLWVSLARSTRDPRDDLLRYAAGTVATVLVLGTVLSPQYVVWLIPLVPLVSGARGGAAVLFFVVAAALTNVWIPEKYFEYQEGLGAGPTSFLLARNLALLATAAVLLLPAGALRRARAASGCAE